ncbi:MAG: hypothetical protein JW829_12430 [Pirellulales bacterium]|nr:hypothetical protein [Pirellulales bacterium]
MLEFSKTLNFATLVCILACQAGCSNPTTIRGTVTYDGKPVEKGAITFTPVDGKGPSIGAKIIDGTYSVEEASPGSFQANVIGVKKVNFARDPAELQKLSGDAIAAGKDSGGLVDPADVIPPDAQGNNQTVDIQQGDQTIDFHIKPPAN